MSRAPPPLTARRGMAYIETIHEPEACPARSSEWPHASMSISREEQR
jgi:hypothetical protein